LHKERKNGLGPSYSIGLSYNRHKSALFPPFSAAKKHVNFMRKRLTEMLDFAKTNLKKANDKKQCYSSGTWDKNHAEAMKNEADQEILIWEWITNSLTDVLKKH
jgi:hypothetical protein